MIDYLKPRCSATTIDSYTNVKLLFDAVTRVLPRFRGTILDVGCGRMPYKPLIMGAARSPTEYIGMDLYHENGKYGVPDIIWDGTEIPLGDNSVDCAILTEVLE